MGGGIDVVAGINLPMLIKLAMVRSTESLPQAIKSAQDAGRKYIQVASQILSGEIAAGFPIMDANGDPVAAIHIAGSLAEWTPADFVQRVVPPGQQAARAISRF